MSVKLKYRIKGLSDLPTSNTKFVHPLLSANAEASFASSKPGRIPWSKAAQCLGAPHLKHYLYDWNPDELSKLWPTFYFVQSPNSRPIKSAPIALAPCFGDVREHPQLHDIQNEWREQAQEAIQINQIADLVKNKCEPSVQMFAPISSAFAAFCFRCSHWYRKNADKILLRICTHPVAAYVALKSGVWIGETNRLMQAVSGDPRLLVDLWKSGRWPEAIGPGLLHEALSAEPHLRSLTAFDHLRANMDSVWSDLMDSAKDEPMAAAFCLGLEPSHPIADEWIAGIKDHPKAMYWSLRLGGWGDDRSKLPYWSEFRELLWSDLRWGYHFVRDYDSGAAFQWIQRHWPNPWTIELVADLKLSKEWTLNQYQSMDIDPKTKDPLLTALTIWSADYIMKTDED